MDFHVVELGKTLCTSVVVVCYIQKWFFWVDDKNEEEQEITCMDVCPLSLHSDGTNFSRLLLCPSGL